MINNITVIILYVIAMILSVANSFRYSLCHVNDRKSFKCEKTFYEFPLGGLIHVELGVFSPFSNLYLFYFVLILTVKLARLGVLKRTYKSTSSIWNNWHIVNSEHNLEINPCFIKLDSRLIVLRSNIRLTVQCTPKHMETYMT